MLRGCLRTLKDGLDSRTPDPCRNPLYLSHSRVLTLKNYIYKVNNLLIERYIIFASVTSCEISNLYPCSFLTELAPSSFGLRSRFAGKR